MTFDVSLSDGILGTNLTAAVRFLDIYQVTQALNTVLTNQKQLMEMRRSWQKIDFESVRNQSALVCNCRHEDLVQLLEHEFVQVLEGLSKSQDPVRDVMAWADKCCEHLMGGRGGGVEERTTMSSRSVLIRWGYVTSQVMRDLVRSVGGNRREPMCSSLIAYRLFGVTLRSVHSRSSSCSWSG